MKALLFALTVCFIALPAYAKYSSGTGGPDDPYQIATAENLMLLGESPEDYGNHFIMTADIDLDPNLPGRKVFDRAVIAPDTNDVETGFQGITFAGVFNGNNYSVLNLTIEGINYLGLFGTLGQGAMVTDLNLENISVNTNDVNDANEGFAGGLAAVNSGSVFNCNCTGTVVGYDNVGGFIGDNDYGDVNNCSSFVSVTGDSNIGGLIGWNLSSVSSVFG